MLNKIILFLICAFFSFQLNAFSDELYFEDILKKAESGDVDAQQKLGLCYEKGNMVVRDFDKAYEWYIKSASQNNVKAQNALCRMYSSGIGGLKKYAAAYKWCERAAKNNDAESMRILAYMILDSKETSKNYSSNNFKKAMILLENAANLGESQSLFTMAYYALAGENAHKNMRESEIFTEKNIKKNKQYLVFWLKKWREMSIDKNNIYLFMMYNFNDFVNNKKECYELCNLIKNIENEAQAGKPEAEFLIASAYSQGIGKNNICIAKDRKKYLKYIEQAASHGHAEAQSLLAGINFSRSLDAKTEDEKEKYTRLSNDLYEKAAMQGILHAQSVLCFKFYRDSKANAVRWCEEAALHCDAPSQNTLGYIFESGIGVRQDLKMAKKWFGIACENGVQTGCDKYKELNQKGY